MTPPSKPWLSKRWIFPTGPPTLRKKSTKGSLTRWGRRWGLSRWTDLWEVSDSGRNWISLTEFPNWSGMPLKGAKGAQGFLLQNHQSVDDVMSNLAKTLVLSCFHGACVMYGSKPGWYLIKPKCFAWHNYILDHVSCFFFKQILPSCNKFFHHRCHLHHGSFKNCDHPSHGNPQTYWPL